VLSIQAGMAGWFYKYYNTQQRTTQRPQNSLQHALASPRPVSSFSFSPPTGPARAGFGQTSHATPSGAFLTPPTSFFPDSFALNREPRSRDPDALFSDMRRRMQENMAAFQRMHEALANDDSWGGVRSAPTMDMREFSDRYEVAFGIPDVRSGDVQVNLDGRVLSIQAQQDDRQTNGWQQQAFQTRVLLPWPVSSNTELQTRFDRGTLVVQIPKETTSTAAQGTAPAPRL
ncbi:MAG: Hsp20/alpha crystallin family protein, partial [Kiritimatiellae bacterium]|nr:Hsp20/alpha crystallin family protein [Kiritimatiellia bacterium]